MAKNKKRDGADLAQTGEPTDVPDVAVKVGCFYRNNHTKQVTIIAGQRVCPGKTVNVSSAVGKAWELSPFGKALLLSNQVSKIVN
ncbi:MAG: hypothetical protein GKR96_04220 [Gammaproteobacteria bacterium]|nr:hypothetical protein [Gammaproteobacteria bacterium]